MKRSNTQYFITESVKNFVRHPLVTVASITTIALMLFILGGFLAFSLNATHVLDQVSQKPPVEIYTNNDVTAEQLQEIEKELSSSPWVANYKAMTPEDNYQEFRDYLGEDSYVLDDFSPELLPYTFVVNLLEPEMLNDFTEAFKPLNGVREVKFSGSVMQFFMRARRVVNLASIVSLIVLGIITFFIISNMVRVSVLARSEEIQIMKYVGATNLYIRIPYVLEGGFVGLLGSILATLGVYFAYEAIFQKVSGDAMNPAFLSLLHPMEILWPVLIVSIVMGIIVGAVGSVISVRKYIQV